MHLIVAALLASLPNDPECTDGRTDEALALARAAFPDAEVSAPGRPCVHVYPDLDVVRLKYIELDAGGVHFQLRPQVVRNSKGWTLMPFASAAEVEAVAAQLRAHAAAKRFLADGPIRCFAERQQSEPREVSIGCVTGTEAQLMGPATSCAITPPLDGIEFSYVRGAADAKRCGGALRWAGYCYELQALAATDPGWALVKNLPQVKSFRAAHAQPRVLFARTDHWFVRLIDGEASLELPLVGKGDAWCALPAKVDARKR